MQVNRNPTSILRCSNRNDVRRERKIDVRLNVRRLYLISLIRNPSEGRQDVKYREESTIERTAQLTSDIEIRGEVQRISSVKLLLKKRKKNKSVSGRENYLFAATCCWILPITSRWISNFFSVSFMIAARRFLNTEEADDEQAALLCDADVQFSFAVDQPFFYRFRAFA